MPARSTARLLFFFLLTFANLLNAQTYLHHQSWTTEDGLPQNTVHQILQTRDGYLWIATEGGLARFDGTNFRVYKHITDPAIASDDISGLAATADDSLWIATGDGLLRLIKDHLQRATGTMPSAPPPDPHWSFSGNTVRFTSGFGFRTWHAGESLPGTRIESLFVDRHGLAWVGTNDGLATLTPVAARATPIPALTGNTILNTIEDREGNIWIGTETSGLHVLRTLKFRTEPALADRALTALTQTSNGAIWAGTRTDGLRRLQDGVSTQPIAPEKLTSPVVLSLAPGPDGSLWAGTPDGLNRIDLTGHVKHFTSADGLPDDYIQALQAGPDGSLWIGTRQGLVHLHPNRHMDTFTTANNLPANLIGTLFLSHSGDLWIATSGGLARRRPDGTITTQTALGKTIVTAVSEEPTGTLWVSTQNHSLTRFAHEAYTPIPLQTDPILALHADLQGNLWLRTERFIQRLPLAALNRCGDTPQPCPIPATYTLADGLPTTEAVAGGSPILWATTNGELWFATRRGVAVTDPAQLPLNSIPPPAVIERFLIDDSTIDHQASPLRIAPGHVRYTMEFAALSFTAPSEVRYRFKLEGLDQTWTGPNNRRSATYTNLRPGSYTFRVQAANNDGLWNETGAVLRFSVVSPFYRRWWFLTLAAFAIVVLSMLLYRLRLLRLQTRFETVLGERNRVAREIHDTLAQDFVGISLQLDMVSHLLNGQMVEAALDQVAQARRLVTDGLADARRSIWELRANLTVDSLPARLAKIVERYSTERVRVRLKIGGAYRNLPQRVENEVVRIAQEALSNTHRHAEAEAASVDLAYGNDMLTLIVADDGRGFSLEAAVALSGHYGVGGMQERAASIGANLNILTAPGAGTTLSLSVPIASGAKE